MSYLTTHWYNNQILTSNNKENNVENYKTEISKQNKCEDGICCFKGNNESMCHQKLLIPLTNFFLSIVDKIYLNLKNYNNTDKLKVHSQIQNSKTHQLRK